MAQGQRICVSVPLRSVQNYSPPDCMHRNQRVESSNLSVGSYGVIAQLGEHLPCKQGVPGSNPGSSTSHTQSCVWWCEYSRVWKTTSDVQRDSSLR